MRRFALMPALAIVFALPLVAEIAEPIKFDGGLVRGISIWGWNGREYRGIPYAAPPVGELRWRPPQPVIPWDGVRDSIFFSPACMQDDPSPSRRARFTIGSEDCLYLNVWTPAASADERLPVMVWIHGGGGVAGAATVPVYDGKELANRGVVVVGINYRLNVFGWFAHPELTAESEHQASGNYGALDQVAALRWVKNNIAQFGGDPDKITMFGHSAGSRSVNWLAASPLMKGLVRGGIGQSHAVFGRMQTLEEAEAVGADFAEAIGKPSLAELRAMPARELTAALRERGLRLGAAIVDGWFLPDDVYTIYAEGRQNDIALLTGATNDEGGNISPPAPQSAAARGATGAAPRSGARPNSLRTYIEWVKRSFGSRADALLKLYPARNDAEARQAYHDVYRDINFAGHRTWAKLQATTGKARVYLYMFSLNPPLPGGNGNNRRPPGGAAHGSELAYVFDNLSTQDYPATALDHQVADTMADYWTNFAKHLDPNGEGLPNWVVYDPNDEYWLNFGETVRLERFNSAGVDLIAEAQEEIRRAR